MRLHDYIRAKYPQGGFNALSPREADVLQPTDCTFEHWQKGGMVLTQKMQQDLILVLLAQIGKKRGAKVGAQMRGLNFLGWKEPKIAPPAPAASKKQAAKAKKKRESKAVTPNKKPAQARIQSWIPADTPDPKTDEFLTCYAWRRLRMEALKLHGARCQCCGASPATGAVMNVDHIKPRKLRPDLALTLDNLQVLCGDCNHGKGNWDTTDWRKH